MSLLPVLLVTSENYWNLPDFNLIKNNHGFFYYCYYDNSPPTQLVFKLHEGLRKAESALLTQARTGQIGLAQFLYKRNVPGFHTATCLCGAGQETPRHMTMFYTYEADRRHYLHIGARRTYTQLIGTDEGAKHFTKWMMFLGRLQQFALAKRLLFDSE